MSRNHEDNPQALASKQVETQLAEGRRLLELEIRNPKELEHAAARRSIWVENNIRVLKDCPLPNNIKDKLLPQASLDRTDTGEDFDAELQSFRDITKTQISVLENAFASIPKPVESILKEEPVGTLISGTAVNRPIAEPNNSLKQRLEQHPIGVAGTLCGACITLVILVMGWYHGESEKALIYKYETQINGMKNDFDAQKRNYEETIRKLNDELAKAHPPDKKQLK